MSGTADVMIDDDFISNYDYEEGNGNDVEILKALLRDKDETIAKLRKESSSKAINSRPTSKVYTNPKNINPTPVLQTLT